MFKLFIKKSHFEFDLVIIKSGLMSLTLTSRAFSGRSSKTTEKWMPNFAKVNIETAETIDADEWINTLL